MIYVYRCPTCLNEQEVEHLMSEVDNPSLSTELKTCCNAKTCLNLKGESIEGVKWLRVPQAVNFLSFGTGDKMSGGTLSKEEKIARINKRNSNHVDKKENEKRKQADIDFKQQARDMINGKEA